MPDRPRVVPLSVMPHAPLPGLLRDMARTASQGRALGTAFDVLVRMYTDPDAVVMVGLAGSQIGRAHV